MAVVPFVDSFLQLDLFVADLLLNKVICAMFYFLSLPLVFGACALLVLCFVFLVKGSTLYEVCQLTIDLF